MVAVKILTGYSTEEDRKECLAYARLMHMLDHENVVCFKGVCFGTATENPQIQLMVQIQYCNAGSLDKLLEEDKLTDEGKPQALMDAAKGIQYLHEHEIIHRDIASRTCLLHKGPSRTIVKISDFGLSRMALTDYELMKKRRLPVFSMPPESLVSREWNKSSDVWSFGILILEMYNKGRNPFEQYFNEHGMNLPAVIKFLKEGKRVNMQKGTPPELDEIATVCMKKVSERPNMDVVVDMLKKYCAKICRG